MTKPPKTMEEIKNAAAERYVKGIVSKLGLSGLIAPHGPRCGFIDGWDVRDKLDNEALKIAVEALELVQNKTETDPAGEVELRARAQFVYYRVRDARAEIRKLRGEG